MKSRIHPAAAIGAVSLTVRDLARTAAFYRERIGFDAGPADGAVVLGTGGRRLLTLHGDPDAPVPGRSTGLYHVAILVPDRASLAAVLRHLLRTTTTLSGASDHGVSEALYLADPEGNGIEIYRDRPRAEWPRQDGEIAMTTASLDVASLLAEADEASGSGVPHGTRIGHVHLRVSDLEAALGFYRDVLGFDLTARYGPAAAFVSAGGYHHHVGLNTWESRGAPAPPHGSAGLRHVAIQLPDAASRQRVVDRITAAGIGMTQTQDGPLVRDPSGNAVVLTI